MKKLIFPLLLIITFCFASCKNESTIAKQINADLVGMLHGKVTVEQILVHDVTKTAGGKQQVFFDCQLYFTDDLYKDNGELAFRKGLQVQETGNKFIYSVDGSEMKLVGFEFGESSVLK